MADEIFNLEPPPGGYTVASLRDWLLREHKLDLTTQTLTNYCEDGLPHEWGGPGTVRRFKNPAACLKWIRDNRPGVIDGIGHGGARAGAGAKAGKKKSSKFKVQSSNGEKAAGGGADPADAMVKVAQRVQAETAARAVKDAALEAEKQAIMSAIEKGECLPIEPERLFDLKYVAMLMTLNLPRAEFQRLESMLIVVQRLIDIGKAKSELIERAGTLAAVADHLGVLRVVVETTTMRYAGELVTRMKLPSESIVLARDVMACLASEIGATMASEPFGLEDEGASAA